MKPELFCFWTAVVSVTVPKQMPTMIGPSQTNACEETRALRQAPPDQKTAVQCLGKGMVVSALNAIGILPGFAGVASRICRNRP